VTAADGAFSAEKTAENGGKRRFAHSFLTEIGCRGLKNVKK